MKQYGETRRSGRAVAAVVLCQLMLMVDGVIVTVALPDIRADLGLDAVGLSWVVSAYALAYAGFLLVSGRIGTLVGPRAALVAGVVVFVVASAAGGLAPDGGLLIAARALQGVGAALAGPAVLVLLVASTKDGPERLRGMAWFMIASSAGSSIGLVAGGLLTVTLGWRWVMLVNVPIGVLVVLATLAWVRPVARVTGRLDVAGAGLSALAMIGLVYGLTTAGEAGWANPAVLVALVVAAVAVPALIAVERGRADGVLPLRLLGSARRWVPFGGALLMTATMISFFTYSVILLQDQRGMDPLQAGLAYLPWSVSVVLGGWLVPRLVGLWGERVTATLGSGAAALGVVVFALLATDAPFWLGVLLPTLLIGFGPPFFFTLANSRIMADAAAQDSGAAAALLQSAQQLGGAVGVAVLTTVQVGLLGLGAQRALTTSLLVAVVFAVVLAALLLGTRAFPGRQAPASDGAGDAPQGDVAEPVGAP